MADDRSSSALTAGAGRLFDALERAWHARSTRTWVTRGLIVAFLSSIGLIELARLELVPTVLGHPMPRNHFHAISWVVTLLLIVEVLDLIFGLAGSVSRSIGKQLEIFSLVLLRKTFDELPRFPEPVVLDGHLDAAVAMISQALGALVVFGLLLLFYRVQRHTPISSSETEVASFIAFKKLVCLFLLAAFVVIGAIAGVQSLTLNDPESTLSLRFFELFFTILIFTDVLVVLASMGGTFGYRIVFRNFGFAFVTVLLRIALAAAPWWNAVLGVAATSFALVTSFLYERATSAAAESINE